MALRALHVRVRAFLRSIGNYSFLNPFYWSTYMAVQWQYIRLHQKPFWLCADRQCFTVRPNHSKRHVASNLHARKHARTCTTRTCTATSTTFRYDRILVSLSPSPPLRSFPPESPPNFLTSPTTHPTDNQAPELEALVQAIAGIRGIDAVAAAAADTRLLLCQL